MPFRVVIETKTRNLIESFDTEQAAIAALQTINQQLYKVGSHPIISASGKMSFAKAEFLNARVEEELAGEII